MSTTSFIQSSPKVKFLLTRFKHTANLAMDRATGHLDNPQAYPLPSDAQSLEHAFYQLFATLPKLRQNKIIDKAKARLQSTGAQRQQHYGELAGLNIGNTQNIVTQAAALTVADNLRFTKADLDAIHTEGKRRAAPRTTAKAVPRIGANPKLEFFIDSLTCEKTSELRKDEVSVAGFAIDALNVVQNLTPFFAGDFKKGDSEPLNRKLFSLDLVDDSSVDLSNFAANLFLTEKDWARNGGRVEKISHVFVVLGLTFVTLAAAMPFVAALGGPFSVTAMLIAGITGILFQIIGAIVGIIGDDTSTTGSDSIVLQPPFVVGTRIDKTLQFEMSNFGTDPTIGRYTAAVHWEIVA